ncbi:MAG: hypothetical protein DWQ34_16530 [Planctomycetota bacterium]|nr:MAG: hypothetical protein DWQ29_19475 [Planctomycetota bacterium]REJ90826.1 MAG: hypothetical protein DWQ34_16530 [Planctomycetota bacterium]REK24298.1 MAG: hypothetical protein DWQ41_14815 [Planctomycetota bacterium]REK28718.1 MAG: hypothetical protein DWQ45_23710 [Planctomycetota bacterium]
MRNATLAAAVLPDSARCRRAYAGFAISGTHARLRARWLGCGRRPRWVVAVVRIIPVKANAQATARRRFLMDVSQSIRTRCDEVGLRKLG